MFSIKVEREGDQVVVSLLLDDVEVPDEIRTYPTPVQAAFRVRYLIEHYL